MIVRNTLEFVLSFWSGASSFLGTTPPSLEAALGVAYNRGKLPEIGARLPS